MEELEHIVEFDKYCETCTFYELQDFEDPCNDCLNHTTNLYSRKPVNYKEK